MSKRTAGVVAGLAVASVAVMATPISTAMASGTASLAASTVKATQMVLAPVSSSAPKAGTAVSPMNTTSDAAPAPAAKPGATTLTLTPATGVRLTAATVVRTAPKPAPKPPVYRVVRKVSLSLPTTAVVGSNVTGFVQVVDDNGQVQSPVPNVRVQFQRKDGARWTVLSDDLTDENGLLQVAFMSQVNMSLRATFVPGHGAQIASKAVNFTSSSQVNWAARPDFDVTPKANVTYAFRINSGFVANGHLEFASTDKPGKWTAGRNASIDPTGLVKARVAFPKPGTYLLRGATGRSTTNAPGYTSVITVVVG